MSASSAADVCGWAGAGLWNIYWLACASCAPSVQPPVLSGGVESRCVWWVGLSTLLGPEGSLTLWVGLLCGPPSPAPVGVGGVCVARVLRTSQWTRASL